MDKAECHLRPARKEDAENFLGLFQSHFSQPVSAASYEWRYFSTSVIACLMTAWDQKKLAGMNGGYIHAAIADGKKLSIFFMIHTIISQNYRGKGVYQELWQRLLEEVHKRNSMTALCVFNNHAGWLVAHRLMKTKLISEVHTWSCPTSSAKQPYSNISFVKVVRFDESVDKVQGLFLASRRDLVMTVRNSDYLNWRFVANPSHHYQIFCIKKGSENVGYLVLKEFTDPVTQDKCGDIVDFLFAREERELLEALFYFSLNYFFSRGVSQAVTWLYTNTLADEIGAEIGFTKTDKVSYFNCNTFDTAYHWLEDKRRWFITMADSEVY